MAQKLPEIKKRKDGYYEMKVTVAPYVRKSIYQLFPTEVGYRSTMAKHCFFNE